ncbi:hypothetical protein BDF20DRAFT_878824 [Mycotypha africana]|uniref:uncharacterized protein n=1 Tax=Mycotypha africana TaxID=64632 RepID=UPI002301E876|nr:uncharacterized protein BDF20DRAFT_878824 [Mycotypha africana]KAI8975460.1 hypothetical protein BDF20DRAFT_878824 [Mycotypha africana]
MTVSSVYGTIKDFYFFPQIFFTESIRIPCTHLVIFSRTSLVLTTIIYFHMELFRLIIFFRTSLVLKTII